MLIRLGDFPLRPMIGVVWHSGRGRLSVHVKFENAGNHYNRLRAISVLQHRKPQRLCAVDEKPAANPLVVLDDPISATVASDMELQWSRARHDWGIFIFFHVQAPYVVKSSDP
jgi:hypothetical protein